MHSKYSRREFVKRTTVGGIGLAAGLHAVGLGGIVRASGPSATVAVSYGPDRADNAFRAMSYFKQQIAAAIGNKRVIIKPNFVVATTALACTNVAWAEGVLEFLKSIGKTHVAFAECPYNGMAMQGYDYNGYLALANKYPVEFMSISQEGTSLMQIFQNTDDTVPSKTIRVARIYQNPNNFIISACPMKTHDTGFMTCSLKNVAMSAPIADAGFGFSPSQTGSMRDKVWMHGTSGGTPGNAQVLNNNVYWMAANGIHPHLSVIDGYMGMQNNGPASGTAVTPQQIGIVSFDYVAADRVALSLMTKSQLAPLAGNGGGIWNTTFIDRTTKANVTNIGPYPAYLNYCGQMGLGVWDLNSINVVSLGFGAGSYSNSAIDYAPNSNILTYQMGIYATPPAPPPS